MIDGPYNSGFPYFSPEVSLFSQSQVKSQARVKGSKLTNATALVDVPAALECAD